MRLFELIEQGRVKTLVIAHRDLLIRFGFEWFEAFHAAHRKQIVVMDAETLSPGKEMVEDLLASVKVYSAHFHGLWSYRRTIEKAREHADKQKIRLEVSEEDATTLEFMQAKCRGLYTFMQMLIYKCQLYGKDLHFLDECNTSKQCSSCGNLQAMPLWKRMYCCVKCGLVMDRDENSAVNILMRFIAPAWATHGRTRAVWGCFHRNR